MRVVISQLLSIVRRYPTLVDGAFVIIALVGVKLLIEYAAAMGWIHFEVPKWLSLGLDRDHVPGCLPAGAAQRAGRDSTTSRTTKRRRCSKIGRGAAHFSFRSSDLVSPSARVNFVALGFRRSSTSGSFHSPCARYSTRDRVVAAGGQVLHLEAAFLVGPRSRRRSGCSACVQCCGSSENTTSV